MNKNTDNMNLDQLLQKASKEINKEHLQYSAKELCVTLDKSLATRYNLKTVMIKYPLTPDSDDDGEELTWETGSNYHDQLRYVVDEMFGDDQTSGVWDSISSDQFDGFMFLQELSCLNYKLHNSKLFELITLYIYLLWFQNLTSEQFNVALRIANMDNKHNVHLIEKTMELIKRKLIILARVFSVESGSFVIDLLCALIMWDDWIVLLKLPMQTLNTVMIVRHIPANIKTMIPSITEFEQEREQGKRRIRTQVQFQAQTQVQTIQMSELVTFLESVYPDVHAHQSMPFPIDQVIEQVERAFSMKLPSKEMFIQAVNLTSRFQVDTTNLNGQSRFLRFSSVNNTSNSNNERIEEKMDTEMINGTSTRLSKLDIVQDNAGDWFSLDDILKDIKTQRNKRIEDNLVTQIVAVLEPSPGFYGAEAFEIKDDNVGSPPIYEHWCLKSELHIILKRIHTVLQNTNYAFAIARLRDWFGLVTDLNKRFSPDDPIQSQRFCLKTLETRSYS